MGINESGGADTVEDLDDERKRAALLDEIFAYEDACGMPQELSAINELAQVLADENRPAAGAASGIGLLEQVGEKCADWNRFVDDIEDCLDRRLGQYATLRVRGDTPWSLAAVGLDDLPMNHTQKHARNELRPKCETVPGGGNCHGLTFQLLSSLPELLEHPWGIWDSAPGAQGVCIGLSAVDGDGLPLVAFCLGAGNNLADGTPNNFIKSVYGRGGVGDDVAEAFDVGRMLAIDLREFERFASFGTMQEEAKEKLESSLRIHYAQASSSNTSIARNGLEAQWLPPDAADASRNAQRAGAVERILGAEAAFLEVIHPSQKIGLVPLAEDPYVERQARWDWEHRRTVNLSRLPFRHQVEAWMQGRLATGGKFTVDEHPGDAFASVGLADVKVTMARHSLSQHCASTSTDPRCVPVDDEVMMDLPWLLRHPIAIWDSPQPGYTDIFAALPGFDVAGKPLLVRITPSFTDRHTGLVSNVVRTCHGSASVGGYIREAARCGKLLYADREQAAIEGMPSAVRSALPCTREGGPLIHPSLRIGLERGDPDPYEERARAGRREESPVDGVSPARGGTWRCVDDPQSGTWHGAR